MRRLLVLVAAAIWIPDAAAADHAARCERYKEQLRRLDAQKAEGGSKARLEKLEAKRHKIFAAQAKYGC